MADFANAAEGAPVMPVEPTPGKLMRPASRAKTASTMASVASASLSGSSSPSSMTGPTGDATPTSDSDGHGVVFDQKAPYLLGREILAVLASHEQEMAAKEWTRLERMRAHPSVAVPGLDTPAYVHPNAARMPPLAPGSASQASCSMTASTGDSTPTADPEGHGAVFGRTAPCLLGREQFFSHAALAEPEQDTATKERAGLERMRAHPSVAVPTLDAPAYITTGATVVYPMAPTAPGPCSPPAPAEAAPSSDSEGSDQDTATRERARLGRMRAHPSAVMRTLDVPAYKVKNTFIDGFIAEEAEAKEENRHKSAPAKLLEAIATVQLPHQAAQAIEPLESRRPSPSLGSMGHGVSCTPCGWFWRPQGCANGFDCRHCHLCGILDHKARKKESEALRKKAVKARRAAAFAASRGEAQE